MSKIIRLARGILLVIFGLQLVSLMTGCCSTKEHNLLENEYTVHYLPVAHVKATSFLGDDGTTKKWSDVSPGTERLDKLTSMSVNHKIYNTSGNAKVKYLTSSASVEGESYRVIYDYMWYREEDGGHLGLPAFHRAHVGVGVRAVVEFKVLEGNVNITGLGDIGGSAYAKTVSGTLSVRVIGITSTKIKALEISDANIDSGSISKVYKAIASVRAYMSDTGIKVDPQILAVAVRRADLKKLSAPDGTAQKLEVALLEFKHSNDGFNNADAAAKSQKMSEFSSSRERILGLLNVYRDAIPSAGEAADELSKDSNKGLRGGDLAKFEKLVRQCIKALNTVPTIL